jgi:hypothetical protein
MRDRRRAIVAGVVAAVLIAAAAVGGYLLLRTIGSPQQTAAAYLSGWQRASYSAEGQFPPGSTFKVVTASALAKTGMRTTSAVQCPSQVTIGGRW